MKQTAKKEVKAYSFDEYRKKFPSPPSNENENETTENPAELGIKLAEKSLAKVRQQARQS
jgi:hypothetical protein